jgi:hypothetical protein
MATQTRTAAHCPTCACAPTDGYRHSGLSYGPIGNPDSRDPFERAQARVADGWHVEGQYAGFYEATTRIKGEYVMAPTLDALVAKTHEAGAR